MVDRDEVAAVLEMVRPSLMADGGDVKLIDVDDEGIVTVELTGACRGCPLSELTLANGIERVLKDRVPGVTRVVSALDLPSGMGSRWGMGYSLDDDDESEDDE